MMKMYDWKDILARAAKTFFQTALSYLVAAQTGVNFFDGDKTQTFWVGLAVSAGAAGVSAVWNTVLQPIFGGQKTTEVEVKEIENENSNG